MRPPFALGRDLQLLRHVALLSSVTGSEWRPNHSDNSAAESTIRARRCGSLRRRAEFLFGAQFALADPAKLGNFNEFISLTAGALLIPGRAPAVCLGLLRCGNVLLHVLERVGHYRAAARTADPLDLRGLCGL